ncbi:hypothetical protein ACWGLF_39640 [Streptomyces puniciscabiei]
MRPWPELLLHSEFAAVAVRVDRSGRGPRLLVEDRRSGRRIHLDPLELASLTWLSHGDLGPFLDPSRTGWRSDEADHGGHSAEQYREPGCMASQVPADQGEQGNEDQ